MLRNALRVTFAFLVCGAAAWTSPALAQAPPRPLPPAPPQATPPAPVAKAPAPQEYRVKQVLGTKVHIQGDLAIGIVDDIVFDTNGQIEYLIVLNEGKLVTVPWQAAKFNFEKRIAVVNITQDQYRVIPNFGLGIFPRFFAPEYRTETYRYYGLTPSERQP